MADSSYNTDKKQWVGGSDEKEYRKGDKKYAKKGQKMFDGMSNYNRSVTTVGIDKNSSSKLENIMQSIQDEAPHALAVSAGAVAGTFLAPMSPIAIPAWAAPALGVGLGCVGYQMSQGAGLSDLVVMKQSIVAAIGAAASTSFGVVGNPMLNTALFTFVGDQAGNYFLN